MTLFVDENPGPAVPGTVRLEVFGIPQPKGSKSAFYNKATGRTVVVEGKTGQARSNAVAWRHAIAEQASHWLEDHGAPAPYDGPVKVTIDFYLVRPASAPRRILLPAKKPDVDKLARAVLDALSKQIYADDARVCDLHVRKFYATDRPAGAVITMEAL